MFNLNSLKKHAIVVLLALISEAFIAAHAMEAPNWKFEGDLNKVDGTGAYLRSFCVTNCYPKSSSPLAWFQIAEGRSKGFEVKAGFFQDSVPREFKSELRTSQLGEFYPPSECCFLTDLSRINDFIDLFLKNKLFPPEVATAILTQITPTFIAAHAMEVPGWKFERDLSTLNDTGAYLRSFCVTNCYPKPSSPLTWFQIIEFRGRGFEVKADFFQDSVPPEFKDELRTSQLGEFDPSLSYCSLTDLSRINDFIDLFLKYKFFPPEVATAISTQITSTPLIPLTSTKGSLPVSTAILTQITPTFIAAHAMEVPGWKFERDLSTLNDTGAYLRSFCVTNCYPKPSSPLTWFQIIEFRGRGFEVKADFFQDSVPPEFKDELRTSQLGEFDPSLSYCSLTDLSRINDFIDLFLKYKFFPPEVATAISTQITSTPLIPLTSTKGSLPVSTESLKNLMTSDKVSGGYSYPGELRDVFSIPFGCSVLDVGGGDGFFSENVLEKKAGKGNVYVLEPREDKFNLLPDHLKAQGKCLTLQDFVKNKNTFPNFPQQFDCVTVLKYSVDVSEKKEFIQSLARAVKPKGTVFITAVEFERYVMNSEYSELFIVDELKKNFSSVTFETRGSDSKTPLYGVITCKGPRFPKQ